MRPPPWLDILESRQAAPTVGSEPKPKQEQEVVMKARIGKHVGPAAGVAGPTRAPRPPPGSGIATKRLFQNRCGTTWPSPHLSLHR